MDDLDFTRPAKSEIYNPAIARTCFETLGKAESLAQGATVFAENDAGDRMYLLLEGEVSLIHGKKTIDIVKAGEIFGELAAITRRPRTATAVARSLCRLISIDAGQFQLAIQATPEFALMLMSIMINRLRLTDAKLRLARDLPDWTGRDDSRVFDKSLLDELARAVPGRLPQRCPPENVIMREGDRGIFMYVVFQGRVAISIQSRIVDTIGPGGVFGEMALVDESPRAATAVAQNECMLLAINRSDFLALVKAKPAFTASLLKAIAERLATMTSHDSR
ncbi:MAG TPA: cyclic nucleotide-binding domain-containing protein [Burkholderiales bacterium]|nr:cyclic nucleotide-binding domain-containing protein [Burkholderiales bacterium]